MELSPPEIYHQPGESVTISREYFEELKQKASTPKKRNAHGWRKPFKPVTGETWSDIDFSEGEYQVSNFGRVLHVASNTLCSFVMINRTKPQQYVLLKYAEGVKRYYSVKELVYRMFTNTIQRGVIYHLDGNPENNALDNLACRQRRKPDPPKATKIRKYLSRSGTWKAKPSVLSTMDIEDIHRLIAEGVPQTEIANRFGVSQGYISRIHISACRQ